MAKLLLFYRIKTQFVPYFKLPHSIFALFFANIINRSGNFVMPFLTLLLTQKLGLPESYTGFIVSFSVILYVPGSLVGGKLADLHGRKRILILSELIFGLTFFIGAFFSNKFIIIYFIFVAILFNGAISPAITGLVADLTDITQRKYAYSLLYLGANIGFAIGPLIAGFLFNKYMFLLFIGDSITTFISTILIVFFVKNSYNRNFDNNEIETDTIIREKIQPEKGWITNIKSNKSTLNLLLKNPILLLFAIGSIFYSFVYSQFQFSLPIHLNLLFKNKGAEIFGILMSTNAITVIVFTLFLTVLTKKYSPITNIIIAGIFYLIGFGSFYFLKSIFLLIVSVIILTLGEILQVTNSSVFLMTYSPITHRSRFSSIIEIISGTGFVLSPIIMGKIIDRYNISYVWIISAILMVIGVFLMFLIYLFSSTYNKNNKFINKNNK